MSRLLAYLIMVQAAERAGAVDRSKVQAALTQGRVHVLTFQIQNGKPVIVWPPERATEKYRHPAPTCNGSKNGSKN